MLREALCIRVVNTIHLASLLGGLYDGISDLWPKMVFYLFEIPLKSDKRGTVEIRAG